MSSTTIRPSITVTVGEGIEVTATPEFVDETSIEPWQVGAPLVVNGIPSSRYWVTMMTVPSPFDSWHLHQECTGTGPCRHPLAGTHFVTVEFGQDRTIDDDVDRIGGEAA